MNHCMSRRVLTEEQVLFIRGKSKAEQQPCFSMNQLARIYGVAVNTIWRAYHGLTYKELGAAHQSAVAISNDGAGDNRPKEDSGAESAGKDGDGSEPLR